MGKDIASNQGHSVNAKGEPAPQELDPEVKTVFVVEDDEAVRDALCMLLESVDLNVRTFNSAREILEAYDPTWKGCLVLDIRMPGLSGLELQERLLQLGCSLPIIFVTGHGDVQMAVRALRKGAIDFLLKPFRDQDILDRIHEALEVADDLEQQKSTRDALLERLFSLTPRELEVLAMVTEGHTNKVVAGKLHLSQRTVETHRASVMEKMQASSLAQLVRMEILLEQAGGPSFAQAIPEPSTSGSSDSHMSPLARVRLNRDPRKIH